MQRKIVRGAAANAGLIFHVFAQDSASTTGAGKASVAFGSWTCYYIRNGEAISGAITPQDITTIGTYAAPTANTNIRIKAVDNTNMIGVYELQLHLDWVNTTNSCQSLTIFLSATGVAVLPIQIQLTGFDPQLLQATPTNITSATGVDITKILGTAISTPATAGILDVNVKNMNNVSGAAITTVKAVQGLAVDGVITTLTNLPAITANWLTAAGIAAGALDGKGNWNIGKTGYSLTATTGLGNQTADITGSLSGSVGSVSGLTAANLDVAVSTRMATYAQPTGFLAATFPGTVGDATAANQTTINGNVLTRMATYTQPTGFLAATFPLTVASPTNITAATGVTLTPITGLGAQTADITGNLSGSVGSVTGSVNSVTGNVGGSVNSVVTAVAITSNVKTNQALARFEFMITDSTTHAPKTGAAAIVATRSIDGTAFAAGTLSAVTEVANGIYYVDFGAGDLNGKVITLRVTATAADDTFATIVTQP